MRMYLDTCCYNRRYDEQSQVRVFLETQAIRQIQSLIEAGELQLVRSYILDYEISRNPFPERQAEIFAYLNQYAYTYIGVENAEAVENRASYMMASGVKKLDALHLSCAIEARCGYFLTTDDRLLKYRSNQIALLNPLDFQMFWGVQIHA